MLSRLFLRMVIFSFKRFWVFKLAQVQILIHRLRFPFATIQFICLKIFLLINITQKFNMFPVYFMPGHTQGSIRQYQRSIEVMPHKTHFAILNITLSILPIKITIIALPLAIQGCYLAPVIQLTPHCVQFIKLSNSKHL